MSQDDMWPEQPAKPVVAKPTPQEVWAKTLIELAQTARGYNEGMRFGQLIFNAISLYDKANYTSEYDSDFHSRLFNIYDEDVFAALNEWYEFVEQQKADKDTSK